MFRVMILDDEPWVVQGIRNTFKWNEFGFTILAEMTDPLEAFEKIKEEKPDVVLTDIRMPEISGIELMRMSREAGVQSEFVVISGVADFHYAQQSLRLGCFDYLLKPLQFKDADRLLLRLKEQLEMKRRQAEGQLLETLLQHEISQARKSLEANGFAEQAGKYYQVVYITDPAGHVPFPLFPEAEEEVCSMLLRVTTSKRIVLLHGRKDYRKLIKEQYGAAAAATATLGEKGKQFSMGISSLSDQLAELPDLLAEAQHYMRKSFVESTGGIFDSCSESANGGRQYLQQLLQAVRQKSLQHAEELLQKIPSQYREQQAGMKEAAALWNQIVVVMSEKESACISELTFMDEEALFHHFDNLQAMCEYLAMLIKESFGQSGEELQEAPLNQQFKQLLNYVNDHYQEDLKLKELSNRFYINYTYCCDLFQKITQSTFTDYVTRLRMMKAEQLLKEESARSILDICDQVGYCDYSYFIKVFKKWFGMTPSTYRKLHIGSKA